MKLKINVRTFSSSYRDIQDKTVGTLSQRIAGQIHSLQGLQTHLEGIRDYLEKVAMKKLPINHQILYQLQDIFNLLPNLNLEEFSKSFAVKTNDQLLVVYVASLIRSVIALHNLIGNKVANREAEKLEKEGEKKKEELKAKKEKEKEAAAAAAAAAASKGEGGGESSKDSAAGGKDSSSSSSSSAAAKDKKEGEKKGGNEKTDKKK